MTELINLQPYDANELVLSLDMLSQLYNVVQNDLNLSNISLITICETNKIRLVRYKMSWVCNDPAEKE